MIEHESEIIFNRPLLKDVFLMGLKCPAIAEIAAPGQFVMVRVRVGMDPLLRRPFSICNAFDDRILLLYRVVGRGTTFMSRVREGDSMSLLGPLGTEFSIPDGPHHPIMVAGGMGIAPMIFLAKTLREGTLMAGFSSASEIIPLDSIDDQFDGTLGKKLYLATDDGTAGHGGPVTDLVEKTLENGLTKNRQPVLYTCGPIPMLKRMAALALKHNIPCQASMEAVMACGLGACQGCAVSASPSEQRDYLLVCRDGPVFPIQRIEWHGG